jgi:glycosyltransferase involved in cell wall biosynthesis
MGDRPKIILAVSQSVSTPPDGSEPDRDFRQLARALQAPLVGNREPAAGRFLGRIQRAMGLDLAQAAHVLRTYPEAEAYVSFSERVGIPLGMALARRRRRPAHLLIAHRLDTLPKRLLNRFAGWTAGVDRMIVLCSSQRVVAVDEFRAPCRFVKGCVVDESFFVPDLGVAEADYVLSIGSESRDYETLLQAAARLPYEFRILASSPWARRRARLGGSSHPNVEFLAPVSYGALRDLYRRARLVVLPLKDVTYAAGLNGVEEAFAVNKPLVVSASRRIGDYVQHLSNAYVVPPGDDGALATAIDSVYRDAGLRTRLTAGASRARGEFATLGAYVNELEAETRAVIATTRGT